MTTTIETMSGEEIVDLCRKHTIFEWSNPVSDNSSISPWVVDAAAYGKEYRHGEVAEDDTMRAAAKMAQGDYLGAIDEYEKMMKEYQTKGQQFQATEKTMTDAMKEVKMKEIQDLENRIQTTQQSAQEKLQLKKQDVYQPVLDKADKAIKDVAKEKGYDYVFDKSQGALLFGKDGDNLLPAVKAVVG